METRELIEHQWEYFLTSLPADVDLEASAREYGALQRRRQVSGASNLLRLALLYGFCGLSLRHAAAHAQAVGLANLSDVALLKRLAKCSAWLGFLLGRKLAERTELRPPSRQLSIQIVDATSLSKPGSTGTDWRVHVRYDLADLRVSHAEVTDVSGGEALRRYAVQPGDVYLADRAYSTRQGILHMVERGAEVVVRHNWYAFPLVGADEQPFPLLPTLRTVPEAAVAEFPVRAVVDGRPLPPLRLVTVRKTEAAAAEARKKILAVASKKCRKVEPQTLELAAYFLVLTNVSHERLTSREVLEVYRFRWQVELVFKRLKSLIHLDALPAKSAALAQSIIYAKLLAALILEDYTIRYLDFSPWGFPIRIR